MAQVQEIAGRRTSADVVFDQLHAEIVSLDLLPGTRMSEVEIAARFGVSRQPVRDAFSRLGNLGFLSIRPQKATEVKRFSTRAIAAARLTRLALEVEIVRRCHARWTETDDARLGDALAAQAKVVAAGDKPALLRLDFEFHRALCDVAEAGFAFDTIRETKVQIDRLCLLSLLTPGEMPALLEDHRRIVAALSGDDPEAPVAAMRAHLGRLDRTVALVRASHGAYFED